MRRALLILLTALALALTSQGATPIVRGILLGDVDGRGATISNAVFIWASNSAPPMF